MANRSTRSPRATRGARRRGCDRPYVETVADERFHPQLVEQPPGHGLPKHRRRPGDRAERREQDAFELDERLLEERDVVEILRTDAGAIEAEADRVAREGEVVLHAREALLFGRGHEEAVAQKG